MDFGAVLDEWDKMQKEAKRKARTGNPVSGKKRMHLKKTKRRRIVRKMKTVLQSASIRRKRGSAVTASSIKIKSRTRKPSVIEHARSSM